MKYLYTIVMAMLVLASCSENERMVYTDTPGIYFPDYVVGADSLVYSFRMKDTDRDTIQIHVKLLGDLLDEAGEYAAAFRKIPRRWPENIMKRCSIGLLMKLINRFLLFRWW